MTTHHSSAIKSPTSDNPTTTSLVSPEVNADEAGTLEGGERNSLSPSEFALVAELVSDGLAIQHKFQAEPSYKALGIGYYESDTVAEIEKAKEANPGRNRT